MQITTFPLVRTTFFRDTIGVFDFSFHIKLYKSFLEMKSEFSFLIMTITSLTKSHAVRL